jgi:hypothetical protein
MSENDRSDFGVRLAGEIQLFQALAQVALSRLVRHADDPSAACSGLKQDVQHILKSAQTSGARSEGLQAARDYALTRVPDIFRSLELTAAALSTEPPKPTSKKLS